MQLNVPVGVVAAGATLWVVGQRVTRPPTASTSWARCSSPASKFVHVGPDQDREPRLAQPDALVLGAAVLLVALFVLWESRQSDPMVPLGFFKAPAFTSSSIIVTLIGVGLSASSLS